MWYSKISKDISSIPDALVYYENELAEAKREVSIKGNVEKASANMPGIVEQRFNQLQELEAILNYMNIELRRLRSSYFKKYLENYQRALSSRDVEKYVDGEPDVVDYEKIINEFKDFDLVLSPAIGGIVIGYEIGRLLKKETIFSERVDGKFVLRRDFLIKKNQRVIIVEDVITTGKSSLECSNIIKKMGATIVGYACIIDRSGGNSEINKIISQISFNIPTYSEDNLPEHLKKIEAVKPGSRKI